MRTREIWCLTGCMLLFGGCDSGAGNVTPVDILTDNTLTVTESFDQKQECWGIYEGTWTFKDGILRQTSSTDDFPLILREDQRYGDVDVSVQFKPLSGHIDASGGLVFRALDRDNYYIVRANALENNFRLYTFVNGGRHQIASARVAAPELQKFHSIRVVAKGDHIQAYLNGELYLDHHDSSYNRGYIGLWTKADSVTDFDDLRITGLPVK